MVHGDISESPEAVSYGTFIVRQAFEKLSKAEQEILNWVGHGATNEQLAQWTGTNVNNARQLRLRSLRRLQQGISTIIQSLPEEERQRALEKMFGAET